MSHRMKSMSAVGSADDDLSFPFHDITNDLFEAIGPALASRLEPGQSTIRRIYYKSSTDIECKFQSHIDTALERLPDGGTPRPFNIVNAWEKYEPRDMKLCAGFVPIKPSGCHFETVRRIRTGFKQPFLHRLTYRPVKIIPDNENAGPPFVDFHEDSARRFLAGTKSQYIIGGGHSEGPQAKTAHDLCEIRHHDDFAAPYRFKHGIPECNINSGSHTLIGALNLHETSAQDNTGFIHVYAITKKPQKHADMKVHIEALERSMKNRETLKKIGARRLGERELGLTQVHGSVQMSLSARKKTLIESFDYNFLSASEKFQEEKRLFESVGTIGPPLANPTQRWSLASWYLHQLQHGKWKIEDLNENFSFPVYHQLFAALNDDRLSMYKDKTFPPRYNGERACPPDREMRRAKDWIPPASWTQEQRDLHADLMNR